MSGLSWHAIVAVLIAVGVMAVLFMEVPTAVREQASDYCNDRGAELSVENKGDWNDERMVCTYPNGTTEPVYVDKLAGGSA